MNEYFLHGKAFMENGGYKEISLVIEPVEHQKRMTKLRTK